MRMEVPLVDLKAQYRSIKAEVERAVSEVMESGRFILGSQLEAFEKEFAQLCGARHAVGVGSGTDALILALKASGIKGGDEVITPANSFVATAYAILAVGARPVLVDVNPSTYTLDTEQVSKALSTRTKGIIPVHLYGHPADMDPLLDIALQHDLVVIEDACQAHGAKYRGKDIGSLGMASCFSFYPAKNLGAYGDGGMVVTNSEQIASRVCRLRNYGQRERYIHDSLGGNSRLDEIQAAVLRVKLRHLGIWVESRRRVATEYRRLMSNLSNLVLPVEAEYATHAYHLFVVRYPNRRALGDILAKAGIETGVHYPIPISRQTAYLNHVKCSDLESTDQICREILSLPMYPELSKEAVEYVADTVHHTVRRLKP